MNRLLLDLLLVAALGSDDYRDRCRAEDAIRARGWNARIALQAGRGAEDPEVRHRCESLYGEALGGVLSRFDPLPEIDSAWFNVERGDHPGYDADRDPEFCRRYARMVPYLDRIGRDCYPWPAYFRATADWLRTEVEAGSDLTELHRLVDEMRWRDSVFLRVYHGGPP